MEFSFNNWGEAVAFLSARTDMALEGVMALNAQQMVDQQVIAALLCSHSHLRDAADTWRQLASKTLPITLVRSLQDDQPASVREAYSERMAYWEAVFRRAIPESE
ncbi:hypothetical protein ACFFJT_07250 [Dyella flava]|uniref:Uncharacterized protein n=1 Tax=Dyella flava TaxID=1920170 RepID=A0ABS2K841_9GAMM|nr:hypothetical protein [Dyella flava]MBM7127386.1 hypothetical protein [Dyella flava]GLQ50983.1 hypothetical protein GCM10010872_24320 [Dyella flava]